MVGGDGFRGLKTQPAALICFKVSLKIYPKLLCTPGVPDIQHQSQTCGNMIYELSFRMEEFRLVSEVTNKNKKITSLFNFIFH